MIGKMPGETLEKKAENLRVAYGFMMGHPGKKLLFMGQDFAQVHEWNENASLEWDLLEFPVHKQMQDYMKALNGLYRKYPAMYELDYDPDGFQWINCSYQQESILIFARKTKKKEETLLFVCNFDNMAHEKFRVGVPFAGKYKEILNSDAADFGGSGKVNPRAKSSKKLEWDDMENSIEINVAPMSICIFTCTPETEAKKARPAAQSGKKETQGEKKTAAKKAGAKKTDAKKAGESDLKTVSKETKTAAAAEAAKPEKKQTAGGEETQKQISTAKTEQKKIATAKTEQKQIGTAKKEQKQIGTAKTAQKQIATVKTDQKQIGTAKKDQKQIGTAKTEQKQIATAKKDQKQIGTAKTAQKQIATAKTDQKKISTAKEEA